MNRDAQCWPVAGVLADEHRREMIAHRGRESALGVAGHGGAEAASPQPTVPSTARSDQEILRGVMVSAAIFIGDFSGSATGIASMRRIVSGASSPLTPL